MRWLFGTFFVAVMLWCSYWFIGSTLIEREARAWFDAQAAQGRIASHEGISVAGFANRFDLTVTEPQLADPASGFGWQAPAVKLYAMTWKPWHLLAALPPSQTITMPGQEITLTSTELSASLRAHPSTDLGLAEARIIGKDLAARSTGGWTLATESLAMALRQTAGTTDSYDLGVELRAVQPDAALLQAMAAVTLPEMPATPLPATIARLHLDASLPLSAPLDRFVGATKPQVMGLELRDLSVEWGEMNLRATGSVSADPQGFAAGEIRLQVTGWQHLPVILVASKAIPERLAPSITNMLSAIAKDTGDGSTVSLPLRLKDGWMSFGPLPLGPAPRLVALPG